MKPIAVCTNVMLLSHTEHKHKHIYIQVRLESVQFSQSERLWTFRGNWGTHTDAVVQWRPLGFAGVFRPRHMNALFSETLWTSPITPKGLWELFILWVVPAIKFDWFAYRAAMMFIPLALSPLHSPSKKWVILGGTCRRWMAEAILRSDRRLWYTHSPNKSRENRLQTL